MPDIIQNGYFSNRENLPWWDGLEVGCLVCACTFAFNASEDIARVDVAFLGNIPVATLPCPQCGNPCSVSYMQHAQRTACTRIREAIDADGEPLPILLRGHQIVPDDIDRIETRARERLLAEPAGTEKPVTASEVVARVRKIAEER